MPEKAKVGIDIDVLNYMSAKIFDYNYDHIQIEWSVIKEQIYQMFLRLRQETEADEVMKQNYSDIINLMDLERNIIKNS